MANSCTVRFTLYWHSLYNENLPHIYVETSPEIPRNENVQAVYEQPNRANATGGVMTKVQKRSTEPLRDVLYQFSMAKEIPDPELLDEYVRLYPDYAEPLTDFAVQLAVESKQPKTAEVPTPEARVSPVVSRAMSRFQSAIHSAKTSQSISPEIESGDP